MTKVLLSEIAALRKLKRGSSVLPQLRGGHPKLPVKEKANSYASFKKVYAFWFPVPALPPAMESCKAALAGLGQNRSREYLDRLGFPGTGSPHVKHSKSVFAMMPLQELHRVMTH